MKTIKTIIILCILGLSFVSFQGNAQGVDCSGNYEAAMRLYNYGMADSALNMLKPCLESKKALKQVSKETSANIFRLAALSSIMTGNPEDAERYVKELLKYQPDYKENIRDDDLQEFRLMLERSTSQPELRIGISGGINIPLLKLRKNYSDPPKTAATFTLEGNTGYQFGLTGEKTLTKNISVEVGAGLSQFLFNYSIKSTADGQYQYDQKITYIEIPVLARYYFVPNSPFQPYIQGGISGKFSLYQREKSNDFGNYWITESSNSDNILATFETDMENIGLVAGGGLSYNLKKLNIRVDFRYAHHFNSSFRSSKFDRIAGYDSFTPEEEFGYTNDINLIGLKNIQISAGVLYNLKYKVF
ncbi:MAG: hypothetical protein AMS27_13020 [Bacteroides sp. SM23_62_1]|nr:MAG: hypothetical protein AMS27_13020 [Bacteroides sp. SM23_62_1]